MEEKTNSGNIVKSLSSNQTPVQLGKKEFFFYLFSKQTFKKLDEKQINFLACLKVLNSKRVRKNRLIESYIPGKQNNLLLSPEIQPIEWEEVKTLLKFNYFHQIKTFFKVRIMCRYIQNIVNVLEMEPHNVDLIAQLQERYIALDAKLSGLKLVAEEMERIASSSKARPKIHKKRIRKKRIGMLCKKCGTTGFLKRKKLFLKLTIF